jgi:hypothetical protein
VAQAVEALRNAMLKAGRSQFEALTAEQLSYGHPAGIVENKAQCINAAMSGQSRWTFITFTNPTIQMVGNSAIVRHALTGETERDGKTNPGTIGVLMVWHTPDGQWQAPLVLLLVGLVGLVLGREQVASQLAAQLEGLMGPAGRELVTSILTTTSPQGGHVGHRRRPSHPADWRHGGLRRAPDDDEPHLRGVSYGIFRITQSSDPLCWETCT